MKATERQALHAYLDDEAWKAWQDFSDANGVSVTALLEALGRELMEESPEAEEHRISWVKAARGIDADRRKRSRRR